MQDVLVVNSVQNPHGLNNVVRTALGVKVVGISTGPYGLIAHLTDGANATDLALASTVLNAHNTLAVATDKATITANNSDTATITCSDEAISGDSDMDYAAWWNGALYSEGSVSVTGGAIELTLATSLVGTWLIEVRRQTGDYASGYVTVTSEEAA